MNMVRDFEEFVSSGVVRKVSTNKERAKDLFLESERKMNSLKENIGKVGICDNNANDYVEYCYDILMFLIRSKLFLEGYSSSGHGAHEAEVSYTRKLGFNENEIRFLNQLRYFRNRILYYGKRFDTEYAEKVIEFTKEKYFKLI